MARVRTILTYLFHATRRNRKSLTSLSGNHLFYTCATFLFLQDGGAAVFFLVIIGLVLVFPLAVDPLTRIPEDRLSLWPLTRRDRMVLRIAGPFLNPLAWVFIGLLAWKKLSPGVWALVFGVFAIGFIVPRLHVPSFSAAIARFPDLPGNLNQLIRKNCRELVSTLDFWSAAVVALPAFVMRTLGLLPASACLPLTLLVMIALSTYSQSMFGLDGDGGLLRYRLLPLRGWQIVAAKDAGFLVTTLVLTFPLSPAAALSAAFTCLAIGHYSSVVQYQPQRRWRFQTSPSLGGSLFQLALMTAMAAGTDLVSPWLMAPTAAGCIASAWRFGSVFERQQ